MQIITMSVSVIKWASRYTKMRYIADAYRASTKLPAVHPS